MSRGFYEPRATTTNFYVNVDNDSGTENGLSHATGYKDLQTGLDGATYGQILWVHQGATFAGTDIAAYTAGPGSNTRLDNSNLDHDSPGVFAGVTQGFAMIGYANGTTLETCYGKDRPLFRADNGNGGSCTLPSASYCMNMRFTGKRYGANNNTSPVLQVESGYIENVEVFADDDFRGTTGSYDRGVVVSMTNKAVAKNCEFIDNLSQSNFSSFTRDAGYEGPFNFNEATLENCVIRIKGDAQWAAFNRTRVAHGDAVIYTNCVFIGNGNQVGVNGLAGQDGGQSFTTNSMPMGHQHMLDRCVLYNMNTGYRFYAPSTCGNRDTEGEWTDFNGRGYLLRNCIIHTCQTGVLQSSYSDPGSWSSGTFSMKSVNVVDSCAFFNITSDQTSGDMCLMNPITLSEDPFVDAANGDFRLNNKAGGGALLKDRNHPAKESFDASKVRPFTQYQESPSETTRSF